MSKDDVTISSQYPYDANLFEAMLRVGKILGLSRSVAMVFAVLYCQDHPVSVEEIADGSCLSRSAVSLALRELIQLGAAREVNQVGERSRRYSGQPDLTQTVRSMVLARVEHPLDELRACLEASQTASARLQQARELLSTIQQAMASVQPEQIR